VVAARGAGYFVHILIDGKIVKSADKKLAEEIEEKGYKNLTHQI